MFKWLKKLFCRCNNNVVFIDKRKNGILRIGKCEKCGKYYLINLARNEMLPINEKEVLDISNDLERLDNL